MSTAETKSESQIMTGADVLVKSLVDHGVTVLFAYPGGASMPLHQRPRGTRAAPEKWVW